MANKDFSHSRTYGSQGTTAVTPGTPEFLCDTLSLSNLYFTRDQESLIQELETAEPGCVGMVIRAVYESDEPQKFMERLDQRIKSHDKEIERMCNFHYQGFIDSIRELLQVRSNAEKLQSEIASVNESLQRSGKALMEQGEELIRCHKIQKNIAASVEGLTLCLPVLETYAKLKEQVRNKRYYPALKTLEQLEHTYLPRVNKYQFSQIMAEHIPKLRDSIKDASMSDLKDFLENIRKHSSKIGEVAMKHQSKEGMDEIRHAVACFEYATLFDRDWKFNSRRSSSRIVMAAEQNNMDPSIALSTSMKQKRRAPPPPNPFTGELDEDYTQALSAAAHDDEEVSAQDVVDFSPVYRCLHINSVLGERDTFETYYRKQRRKQARLALQPPHNMHESVDGYRKYLHDIIGFFVVEDHILNTTSGLVTRAYIDELWDMALTKVVAMLRTNSAVCIDPQLMLELKSLIVLFSHTLRGYGFPVGQLNELLLEVRGQYTETLMRKWVHIFNEIFDDDNYTPICAETAHDYTAVMDVYPFIDASLDKAQFPKRFPFSQFVPKVYTQVKQFIYACLKFTDDLHLSQTDIDDMVRKSANVLLTRALSGCLSSLIKRPNLTLLQLIQVSINMNYLEQSCGYLEDFITNITGTEKDSVHAARLHGTAMFKDARNDAEAQIYKSLNTKIDEFLELAVYDWTMSESQGHASSYMLDLLAFLRSIFLSFTNLPPRVAQTACASACSHMAQCLMELVLDNDVRQLTTGALQQLNLDLMQCELFAASEPVPGLSDISALQSSFTDLRQLLDVVMTWDWSCYLADYGQPSGKYARVRPHAAINLLEKMRESDKKKNLFALKKNDKDRRRLMELVIKQLRGLSNGTASHT